jgi:hypothetical protein
VYGGEGPYYGEGAKVDEFQTSSIIYWYEELEERLIEFLKFFPFIPPNKYVHSPRLAGVVTEICHILDSLFREVFNPKETTKKKEKLNVTDYAALYAKRLSLPATKSLMFVSPPQYVMPFKEWEPLTTGGEYKPLPWWAAYTKLKHSRIENIKQRRSIIRGPWKSPYMSVSLPGRTSSPLLQRL